MLIQRIQGSSAETQNTGATLVEFAMTLGLLMIILGAFFDVGLGIYNWMLLRHVTAESTRQIAINFATFPKCSTIKDYLSKVSTPRLRKDLGADVAEGKMKWEMQWVIPPKERWDYKESPVTFRSLRLTGSYHFNCYFLCHLFPKGWELKATNESVVEREFTDIDQSCDSFSVQM